MHSTFSLAGQAARHPLRAALARAAFARLQRQMAAARQKAIMRQQRRLRISAQDLREFLLAYCACFLAVSIYIA